MSAAVTASCGNVMAQCRLKVYKDKFLKNGKPYGIDYATGYLMFQVDDDSLSLSSVHADYQNFNGWNDAKTPWSFCP